MSTYSEKIGSQLNSLLEKTYDAEKGFKKAAENAKETRLKGYFERKSKERRDFGHQLKTELIGFGQKPDKNGSATGTLHRTWMDVKALFSSDSDEAMLNEAITGEKAAIEEYADVLKETSLPPSTIDLLTKQKYAISEDLDTIKKIEDLH